MWSKKDQSEAQLRYNASVKGKAQRAKQRLQDAACRLRIRLEQRNFLHVLKDVPCRDCGERFDPVCMDFDHRPDEIKLFQLGDLSVGRARLAAEIAKCDIVCANCHRYRTYVTRTFRKEAEACDRKNSSKRQAAVYRGHQKELADFRALIKGLKQDPCLDCKRCFHAVCMDFDHRPNERKLFAVGSGGKRGRNRLLAEIAKCDLVCANCHRLRTHTQRKIEASLKTSGDAAA